tara:strand:+ start:1316 stop:1549 length:234 start_codon:yes stop_codon:yes gene_type:complete
MDLNEPQIINYYNDLPEYAVVIENLNEEYDQLITNYIRLNDRINPPVNKKKDNIYIIFLFLIIIICLEYGVIIFFLI